MTNLTKKWALSSMLSAVAVLASACGGAKESATPMQPNTQRGGGGVSSGAVMKSFRGYKADAKLASGVSGASAEIKASTASSGLIDASVKVLLHATSGELVALSASGVGLEPGKTRILNQDATCGNAKFDVEALCSGANCPTLVLRIIEKPAANSPKISELEVGKPVPDTTGYAQTGLVFVTKESATVAHVARASRQSKQAVVKAQVAATDAAAAPVAVAAGVPVKMMRRWSERWTSTAQPDSAAGVKTTFEEAIVQAKSQGTNTSAVETCVDPTAVAAPVPAAVPPAASTVEPATTKVEGVSEISGNPLE